MSAPNRGRRGDYRPVVRRSRSPVGPQVKRRSYTPPPMKRKASPGRERELVRRRKMSKSPVGSRGGSQHRSYAASPPPNDSRLRAGSGSDRFRGIFEEDKERAVPQFRGPEGPIDFDVNELKKFTVQIVRKPHNNNEGSGRSISNPEDIAPVRRYGEGSRPLFSRGEAPPPRPKDRPQERDRPPHPDEYRRIVNVDTPRPPPGRERERSRDRERRYSPGYEDGRRYYERERSPYESRHRSPPPPPPRDEYIDHRDKIRDRPPEDLRRDLDGRRREDRRYSPARHSYERESDLRSRIIEKRTEPTVDREHSSSRRYEGERERHGRPHHSPPPPPRDRRRPVSADRYESSRGSRSEHWEREKDRDGDRRRQPGSRERQDKYEDRREYEPKKFYKNHDAEFIPPPTRGRGGPPMHRGGPPMMRGRGMPRGINRGFRGGMMGGMPRGLPRPPFMGMRGFPPRFFPPF